MKIAILGAGISGLSLSWYLEKKGHEVVLIEKEERVGGWIKTRKTEEGIAECGPRTLRGKGALIELIEELDLEKELLMRSRRVRKFFLENDMLVPMPQNFFELCTTSLGRKALFGCFREIFSKKGDTRDESISAFFERRFGKGFRDAFLDPLCLGIFAEDPEKLSMESCFPLLFDLEKKYRSIILGTFLRKKARRSLLSEQLEKSIFSFKNGLETLTQGVYKALKGTVLCSNPVQKILFDGNSCVVVTPHHTIKSDIVITTLAPPIMAKIEGIAPPIGTLFSKIPMVSIVTVTLTYDGPIDFPSGFGALAQKGSEKFVSGILFESALFEEHIPRNSVRFSVMMKVDSEAIKREDTFFINEAKMALQKYLTIKKQERISCVIRSPNCIASYPVGHKALVFDITRKLKESRIFLAGSGYFGVSIAESIENAKKMAEELCCLFTTTR